MTITGEHGAQDTVKPQKIVSEPDNEALASILDHSVHTMPLTLIDADKVLMSSLYNHGSDDLQDDVVSFVNGSLCSHLACIYRLIDQADANMWKTLLAIAVRLKI